MLNELPSSGLHVEKERPDAALHSPEYVQLSTAAALTLGLARGRMYRCDCTRCLNLLLTYAEGCRANCSYCGLARHREEHRDYAERNFIRVDWPTVSYTQLLARMQQGGDQGRFERMCISMITHPRATQDTLELLTTWVAAIPAVPVSILSNPTTMQYRDLLALHGAGADIFTVALDAATPAIFERTRGATVESPHSWKKYWQAIEWAAEIYGAERFGAHLICGMGETEQEMVQVVQRLQEMGGHSHMFAFFPERGSLMEEWGAVPMGQWRRVQLARFLIDYRGVRASEMRFDAEGRIIDFGLSQSDLLAEIHSGKPFLTSGCPGQADPEVSACNRPYGDSPPSDIRSFPFTLADADIDAVLAQIILHN